MVKKLHQVWIQGEAKLPESYQQNRDLWRAALPDDWELVLWDNEIASSVWKDYAMVEGRCFHHATRTDLILARAQRDFGGLATGTDVIPLNIPNLLHWLEGNGTLVLANIESNSASNGLSYFGETNHPFITAVCEHQLRDLAFHGIHTTAQVQQIVGDLTPVLVGPVEVN